MVSMLLLEMFQLARNPQFFDPLWPALQALLLPAVPPTDMQCGEAPAPVAVQACTRTPPAWGSQAAIDQH